MRDDVQTILAFQEGSQQIMGRPNIVELVRPVWEAVTNKAQPPGLLTDLTGAGYASVAEDPQLWCVSDEIAPKITKLAASVPRPHNDTISPESIPARSGIVSVPSCVPAPEGHTQRIITHDGSEETMPILHHAISWHVLDVADRDVKLFFVYPWCYAARQNDAGEFETLFDVRYSLPLPPEGILVGAPFNELQLLDADDDGLSDRWEDLSTLWASNSFYFVRWLLALFAWSAEEAETGSEVIPRQQRRTRARAGQHEATVRTLKLRRHSASAGDCEGTGAEVSPHWRRGHWRNQRVGPGRSQSRLVWVRSHIVHRDRVEDPESLRPTTTVRSVDRV